MLWWQVWGEGRIRQLAGRIARLKQRITGPAWGELTMSGSVSESRGQISTLVPQAGAVSAAGERHRCMVFHAGNPAVIGNPLDRWLCDPFFRKVCLLQMSG